MNIVFDLISSEEQGEDGKRRVGEGRRRKEKKTVFMYGRERVVVSSPHPKTKHHQKEAQTPRSRQQAKTQPPKAKAKASRMKERKGRTHTALVIHYEGATMHQGWVGCDCFFPWREFECPLPRFSRRFSSIFLFSFPRTCRTTALQAQAPY